MLSTDDIMRAALTMAGLDDVPGDCGIYVPSSDVNRALFGVDIGPAELLLARELGCDLALAHHPNQGTMGYTKVLSTHLHWMTEAGVPTAVATDAISDLVERLELHYHRGNWAHTISVAQLLEQPYMNIHSPLDLIGRNKMLSVIKDLPPSASVGDVVQRLNTLPEYQCVPTAIQIMHGSADNEAGRVAIVHGAGTNGGFPVARAYFEHGVSTVIYIHIEHSELKKLREYGRGNLIVCGHIAGDLLGMNEFRRWLESQGVEVVSFSGLDAV